MPDVFCCSDIEPYRPRRLDHEPKFTAFLGWAGRPTTSLAPTDGGPLVSGAPYAVQIVRQINFGPQESIKYFVPASNGSDFVEATEDDMLKANFEKLNSYKNFRCGKHNRFFELNLYQKNAINTHHWRVSLARPTKDIDLAIRQKGAEAKSEKVEEVPEGEETREPPPSSPQRKTSSLSLRSPFLQAPQARHGVAEGPQRDSGLSDSDKQSASRPDIATLKRLLRFLLPTAGTNLGSNPILSLLALDWTNEELALGLDFETFWDAELTSSNIIIFLCGCFEMSAGDQVDVAEVEDLVIPAMRHAELFGRQCSHNCDMRGKHDIACSGLSQPAKGYRSQEAGSQIGGYGRLDGH